MESFVMPDERWDARDEKQIEFIHFNFHALSITYTRQSKTWRRLWWGKSKNKIIKENDNRQPNKNEIQQNEKKE